jgi:amidase
VNPSINAVVVVLAEQALDAATAADRAIAAGSDLPPLHGVPFTIKDNIDLAHADHSGSPGAGRRVPGAGRSWSAAATGYGRDPDRPHQPPDVRDGLGL